MGRSHDADDGGPGTSLTPANARAQRVSIGPETPGELFVDNGNGIRSEEIAGLVAYLNKYHGMPVNLNKASAAEIQSELQIPAEDARAIVEGRRKGSLKAWPDLEKIQGLNIKKLEPVRDRIMFQ